MRSFSDGPARIATMASVNPRSAPFFQAFEQRLRELGWADGQNIAIDFRGPMSPENYPAVAAEFVRQGVEVILPRAPTSPRPAKTLSVLPCSSGPATR
jgi:hypothetical protein